MTSHLEDRLREVASRLDHASERYRAAHLPLPAPRHRSRRVGVIAASILVIGALVIGAEALSSRKPAPALAPTVVSGASTSTQLGPTTTVKPTATTQATRPTVDPTHTPIRDGDGNRVGWIDDTNQADIIYIPLPESYTSLNPLFPTAIGVTIVRDDNGTPVGVFSGLGFIPGAVIDETHIDPAIQQQLIDNAIANTGVTTIPPASATAGS
jgi:hypothetical protein